MPDNKRKIEEDASMQSANTETHSNKRPRSDSFAENSTRTSRYSEGELADRLIRTFNKYDVSRGYESSGDEESYDKDPLVADISKNKAKEYYRKAIEDIALTALPASQEFKEQVDKFRQLRERDRANNQPYQKDTLKASKPIAENLKSTSFEHNPILRRAHRQAVKTLINDGYLDENLIGQTANEQERREKLAKVQEMTEQQKYSEVLKLDNLTAQKDGSGRNVKQYDAVQKEIRKQVIKVIKDVSKGYDIKSDDFIASNRDETTNQKLSKIVDYMQHGTGYLYAPIKADSMNSRLDKDINSNLEGASFMNSIHHNVFREAKHPTTKNKDFKKYELNPANLSLVGNDTHELIHAATGLDRKLLETPDTSLKTDIDSQNRYMDAEILRQIAKKKTAVPRTSKSDEFKITNLEERTQAHADYYKKEASKLEEILQNTRNQPEDVLRQKLSQASTSNSFSAKRLLELHKDSTSQQIAP